MIYSGYPGLRSTDPKAIKWYLKAAEQGDGDAQNNLGYMYERGMAVEQSYEKAAEWYQKGVYNDNAFAMFYLGRLYEAGRGVPRSARRA